MSDGINRALNPEGDKEPTGIESGRVITNQPGAWLGKVMANQSGTEPGKVIPAFLCAYIAAWGKKTDRKKTDIGQ